MRGLGGEKAKGEDFHPGIYCSEETWSRRVIREASICKSKNMHEESDMRPACFSNWKTRGFCVEECPHTEACLEESLAGLPPEVRRLVSELAPGLRLESRRRFWAWERRSKKPKK